MALPNTVSGHQIMPAQTPSDGAGTSISNRHNAFRDVAFINKILSRVTHRTKKEEINHRGRRGRRGKKKKKFFTRTLLRGTPQTDSRNLTSAYSAYSAVNLRFSSRGFSNPAWQIRSCDESLRHRRLTRVLKWVRYCRRYEYL